MKFGKEFTSQMVQEWQTAYMDYNHLKIHLKDVMEFRKTRSSNTPARTGSLKRRLTMYRAFSGLANTFKGSSMKNEDEVILFNDTNQGSSCQTTFLRSSEDGGEYELIFFRRLDAEFNKVIKFYKDKVEEVKGEADELSKQMDALIALRIKVDKPNYYAEQKVGQEVSVARTFGSSEPGSKQGEKRMESIQEVEMSNEQSVRHEQIRPEKTLGFRPASIEVLDHVKINVEPDTPVLTLRNVILSSKSDLSFSKHELRDAEEKLRQAFIDFYQQLWLVKSYSFLNVLAFSKIMKKYDKITSRSASKAYLEMVEKSYLGSCNEVNKLIERLENTFVKHFSNGNRRKGMKCLKPKHKRERHRTSFFIGLLTGGSIALTGGILVTIHARKILNHEGRQQYMETLFPLYSLFGFIFLHMIMYGANTYYWRRFRVNYPFIFGFKPGTELGFREIFLLASGLSVLALAAVLTNLDMEMDKRTQSFQPLTELVPLGLVVLVFSITISPFNILYRSSRYFLMQCTWRCLCAPLYKITLPDFFLADQLTSQVQALRSLQFYICYYGWGNYKTRNSNKCNERESSVYEIFYIVVVIIPFWSRALQCLRRLFEEKDMSQAFNALKYMSTVVALVIRTVFSIRGGPFWKIMAWSTSGVTTIYNTYWDIVIDWGFLQRKSKNPWLRDKLLISNKSVYFLAIVLNILLRLVWMQLVFNFQPPFLHRNATIAVVACLEIIRRGIWNFFRVENEHFNNVGKYRAFKTVPLPFHYDR